MVQRILIALLATALIGALSVSCSSSRSRRHMGPAPTMPEARSEGQNEPELRKGMTAAEVRQLWGEPRDTMTARDDPETQVWTYERRRLHGAVGGQATRAVIERVVVTLTFKKNVLTYIEEKVL